MDCCCERNVTQFFPGLLSYNVGQRFALKWMASKMFSIADNYVLGIVLRFSLHKELGHINPSKIKIKIGPFFAA